MDTFLKTVACIFVLLLLCLVVGKGGKDFSMLITTAGCCLIGVIIIGYLDPVISFIKELQITANINTEIFETVLKSVGIALLAEFCTLLCSDCGNASIGRMVQLLGSSVILWLSIPLFRTFLSLVEKLMVTV